MRRIRWWGLAVFVVIVGGTIAAWVAFADTLVRRGIEAAGTRMVGARVELAGADVGFSPARLQLQGLEVTNPDAPMRNAVAVRRIAFDLDWLGLFLDRVHIGEMALEGLRFDTERDTSGAVGWSDPVERADKLMPADAQRASLPPLEVPSAGEVLEREQLESPQVIADSQRKIAERRKRLDKRLDELPGATTLADYRQELDEIGRAKGAVEQVRAVKRLRDLVDAIDEDLKRLRRARDEAEASVDDARAIAGEARRAPAADIQRLYRKYTDPEAVAGELMHYLLDPAVAGWLNSGWYWYQRLSPYLGGGEEADAAAVRPARGAGRVVEYPEAGTEPSFLIRRIRLSGGEGDRLDGRITDIATPASQWGEPLRIDATGEGVAGYQRLALQASVDRRTPGESKSRIDFDGTGASMSGWALGQKNGLTADRGTADIRVAGTVTNGALDLDLSATVSGARFQAGSSAEPLLANAADAMSDAGRIQLKADVTGTTDDPEIRISSSLQGLLAPVLREGLEQAASGFRDELAQSIRDRTAEPLAEIDAAQTELESLKTQLTERIDRYEDTLERARKKLD